MARKAEYPIAQWILNRWSPRAMSGESITHAELFALFEAARWAPSSYNNQPWRFVYAHRGQNGWDELFGALVSFNQAWAENAAVLVVIISKNTFDKTGKPSRTHSFDTGAAWQNLALQGSLNNVVVHGMEGFDYEKVRQIIKLPDGYTVQAMCAIGKPGKKEDLPADMQEREEPSDRKKVEKFVSKAIFKEV